MSLLEHLHPILVGNRPVVIHGSMVGDSTNEFVKQVLELRKGEITMFPAFSGPVKEGDVVDISTAPILTGSIAEAALVQLGSAVRTLHPTHSWIVTGRSAAMHILGNIYAMSPSGMGCPLGEVTNFSGLEIIVGGGIEDSVVLEAAEETAKVPYGVDPAPTNCAVVDSTGKKKEAAVMLRSAEPIERNLARIKELWVEADALIEESWGSVIHTRMALDSLVTKLRVSPRWLIEG